MGIPRFFFAADATTEGKEEHRQLVEVGRENWQASLGFFADAIKKALE